MNSALRLPRHFSDSNEVAKKRLQKVKTMASFDWALLSVGGTGYSKPIQKRIFTN